MSLPPVSQRPDQEVGSSRSQRSTHSKSSMKASERSSRSQQIPPLQPSEPHQSERASLQSSKRSAASTRSITSSVALSKLRTLEEMLMKERTAREMAEDTLVALQRERIAREQAMKQSEHAQKQLSTVMSALQRVLTQPNDPASVRKLQAIVRGMPVNSATRTDSANAENDSETSSVAEARAAGQERSTLDGLGQNERDKKKRDKQRRVQ